MIYKTMLVVALFINASVCFAVLCLLWLVALVMGAVEGALVLIKSVVNVENLREMKEAWECALIFFPFRGKNLRDLIEVHRDRYFKLTPKGRDPSTF